MCHIGVSYMKGTLFKACLLSLRLKLEAMKLILERLKLVIEPTTTVPLAVALFNKESRTMVDQEEIWY